MILPSKSTTTHIETHFDTTGRAEAEAFLSEIEGDGAKAGEVFAEVAAKAESANAGSQELAGRVKALEDRATVSKDSEGRIQATDPAEPGDVATKRYVDNAISDRPASAAQPPQLPFVAKAQEPTGSWSKWDTTTLPDWVDVERSNERLHLPAGRYRVEALTGSAIPYIDGKLAGAFTGVRLLESGSGVDLYASATSNSPTLIVMQLH